MDDLPRVQRWIEKVGERPAVQRGRAVPTPEDQGTERVKEGGRKILV